jgi:hypothetical protein
VFAPNRGVDFIAFADNNSERLFLLEGYPYSFLITAEVYIADERIDSQNNLFKPVTADLEDELYDSDESELHDSFSNFTDSSPLA